MSRLRHDSDRGTAAFVVDVDGLLAAGTAAAQRQGFTSVYSDVDTLNAPMLAAMERGRSPHGRPPLACVAPDRERVRNEDPSRQSTVESPDS